MQEALTCRYPDCGRTRASSDDDFCVQHAYAVRSETVSIVDEANYLLRMEAEFIRWCEEHGQPHPHED